MNIAIVGVSNPNGESSPLFKLLMMKNVTVPKMIVLNPHESLRVVRDFFFRSV